MKALPVLQKVAATGIEPSATALSLFVVAFCVLALRARCLSLRSPFSLNLLALLHCCYMERFWDMGLVLLSCCRFLANDIISWMWSVLWLAIGETAPDWRMFASNIEE